MHRNMALAIASYLYLKIPVTPNQKESIWEQTYDMLSELSKQGFKPTFNMHEFNDSELFSRVLFLIQKYRTDNCIKNEDWVKTPYSLFEFFFINQ